MKFKKNTFFLNTKISLRLKIKSLNNLISLIFYNLNLQLNNIKEKTLIIETFKILYKTKHTKIFPNRRTINRGLVIFLISRFETYFLAKLMKR